MVWINGVKVYGLMFTIERLEDGSAIIKKYDTAHGRWEIVKKAPDWDTAEMMAREWWIWLV